MEGLVFSKGAISVNLAGDSNVEQTPGHPEFSPAPRGGVAGAERHVGVFFQQAARSIVRVKPRRVLNDRESPL